MTATPRPDARPSPGWRAVRALIRRGLLRTCRRQLGNRALHLADGEEARWLPEDIERFLVTLDHAAEEMREIAGLQGLPDAGSRLMVELAIYTVAAGAALRHHGVETGRAHAVVADVGWDLYRRMLRLSSLPARFISRDPGRRLRWTIRALLVFPFRPVGAPGYAARVFRDGDDLKTHFTHCPPQTFARTAAARHADPELLEAFRQSWCLYDWPGADLIAGDGKRGHYRRPHTLSAGDPVCNMCWKAQSGEPTLSAGKARASRKGNV